MKLIFRIFFFLFILSIFKLSFAVYTPVEDVFKDIDTSYKYYNELQDLYDRQAIYPDSEGKFNPYKLLTRDEFVGISLEVSCKKCTKPNASLDIATKYSDVYPFFDVDNTNKYSYCIALANDQNYVEGYNVGVKCEDGSYEEGKAPFCPNNYISLEEAIAVILRNSNLFSIEDNNKVIADIKAGNITDKLSIDVGPTNEDGSVYTFYGYLRKALNYSITEYDNLGNKKVYKLLELTDGKIYPKKSITKEEFLKMAYIALKTNSCKEDFINNLALKMEILDNQCTSSSSNCSLADLTKNEKTFDLEGISDGVCEKGIDENSGYIWRFYNNNTGEEIIKYGKYLDNYTFLTDGTWDVYLEVVDNCSNAGEVHNTIVIKENDSSLDVSIDANPIIGTGPLLSSFKALVGGGDGDYTYNWNFGNQDNGNGKSIDYIFTQTGVFNVSLTVTDGTGKQGTANVLIKVTSLANCDDKDSDNDGVNDCDDLCPLVAGSTINKGCPIITKCDSNCACPKGETCNTKETPACYVHGVCIKDDSVDDTSSLSSCIKSINSSYIYGNVVCNTCPCSNFVDFIALLRRCDLIFPAITSTGSTSIYSAGSTYEVK